MTSLLYGSLCSGIEAATVAWEPLGYKAAWFSEIELLLVPYCTIITRLFPIMVI